MSERFVIIQNIYENAGYYPWMVQDTMNASPVKRKPFYSKLSAAIARARELNEQWEQTCRQIQPSKVVAIR